MALGHSELITLSCLLSLAQRREIRLTAELQAMQRELAELDARQQVCRETRAHLCLEWQSALARRGVHAQNDFGRIRSEVDDLRAQVGEQDAVLADLLREHENMAQRIVAQRHAVRANAIKQEKLKALISA